MRAVGPAKFADGRRRRMEAEVGRRFRHQVMLLYVLEDESQMMRSPIDLDDTLMDRAKSLTGAKETSAPVRQALETLVRVESTRRLIALGGTMPDAEGAPRRQSTTAN